MAKKLTKINIYLRYEISCLALKQMLQRYSHFLLIAIALFTATVIGFNFPSSSSEANQEYFVKPIPQSNLVVVEPNYGHIFHDGETEAEATEALYRSLPELRGDYNIRQTQLVAFERKGKLVPNLYVKIDQTEAEPKIANNNLEKSAS